MRETGKNFKAGKGFKQAVMVLSLLSLIACGNKNDRDTENIELLDPVSVAVSSVAAGRRDLYDYEIHSAICCPPVKECTLTNDITFKNYERMPGVSVNAGDILISGESKEIDRQIEDMQESIDDDAAVYADDIEQLSDAYDKTYKERAKLYKDMEEQKEEEPDEEEEPKEYKKWEMAVAANEKNADYQDLALKQAELQVRERQELYLLDHARLEERLSELQEKKNKNMLISEDEGTVVGIGFWSRGGNSSFYNSGDWIASNTTAMAVADTGIKELKSDYVSSGIISRAEDVYAIVNGERVEVEYQPVHSEEFGRLTDKYGAVYSSFIVNDDRVSYGDYAVIVIRKRTIKGALAVPSSSVTKDGADAKVHVLEDGNYVERQVRCGFSDGTYTEILSGLSDGEMIKAEFKINGGTNEAVVSRGKICAPFSENAYLYYPSTRKIVNPVENGVTYLDEICVNVNEQVQAGQVIAKVHVVSDGIESGRIKRSIQRLQEQRDFYVKDGEKRNKYNINSIDRQMAKENKRLSKLSSDAAVTEIKAETGGMITELAELKPGDLLEAGASVGRLADDSSCFAILQDENGKLSYGNEVNISYKDNSGQTKNTTGMVVTANAMTLSKELKSGMALISLPSEAVAEIAGSSQNSDGWWSLARVGVSCDLRVVDNVLTVPKNAVTDVDGISYVTVKDDNGALRMVSFVSGGSDANNTCILEGLEEGTKVCWE